MAPGARALLALSAVFVTQLTQMGWAGGQPAPIDAAHVTPEQAGFDFLLFVRCAQTGTAHLQPPASRPGASAWVRACQPRPRCCRRPAPAGSGDPATASTHPATARACESPAAVLPAADCQLTRASMHGRAL